MFFHFLLDPDPDPGKSSGSESTTLLMTSYTYDLSRPHDTSANQPHVTLPFLRGPQQPFCDLSHPYVIFNDLVGPKLNSNYLRRPHNVWVTKKDGRPEDSHHVLRNKSALTVPFTRLSTLSKHPLVNLPKTWIEFKNENVKILRNKVQFKINLKKHLLSGMSAEIICNLLLCPIVHPATYMPENPYIVSILLPSKSYSWVVCKIEPLVSNCTIFMILYIFISEFFILFFRFLYNRCFASSPP